MERITIRMYGRAMTDFQNVMQIVENRTEWSPLSGIKQEQTYSWFGGEAIERLAAYEDTGLTPEEVLALRKDKWR